MDVVFYAIVALLCFGAGVYKERYFGEQPKLQMDDWLNVIDLIDVYCEENYERVHAMRDELNRWMENPMALEEHLSSELLRIIKQVRDGGDKDFD